MMLTPFLDETVWFMLMQDATIKGIVALAVAGMLVWQMRRVAASTRHLIWCAVLGGMLLLPVMSYLLPALEIPVLPRLLQAPGFDTTAPVSFNPEQSTAGEQEALPPPSDLTSMVIGKNVSAEVSWPALMYAAWWTGVLLVLMRFGAGLFRIAQLTRRASLSTAGDWDACMHRICRRIGLHRQPPVYFTNDIDMPLTWGVLRPVVVLPASAVDWSREKREIVLAHECAHIRRFDCLTQMMVQVTCAVYWFNPLVWLAARQHRIERERACDDQVLNTGAKASDYADHLLGMVRTFRSSDVDSLATVAFARRSQLEGRLLSILDPQTHRRRLTRPGVILTLTGIASLIIFLAVLQPATAAQTQTTPAIEPALVGGFTTPESVDEIDEPALELVTLPAEPVEKADAQPAPEKRIADRPITATAPDEDETYDTTEPPDSPDFLDGLSAIGYNDLTIQQIIAFKTHGVTPAFIKQIHALGYRDISVPQILSFRIHGITAAYIGQMNAEFDAHISAPQLLAARIHGVSPRRTREIRAILGDDLNLKDILNFRIHGITPEWVEEISVLRFTDVGPETLLSMRIHGVTPDFIRDIDRLGYTHLTFQDFISFRIHGITPAFIEKAHERGFYDLTADELIDLRRTGIIRD